MERRKFIKNVLLSLPAVVLAPSCISAATKSGKISCNKSVIVIGAGISGLAAAKKLKQNGFTVTVLESNSKIGGRLSTDRSLGIPFDEGASWIHGVTGNPITSLAQDAGMTSFTTDDNSFISYDIGGVVRSDALYSQTENQYYDILDTLMNNGSLSQSFETVFNNLYTGYSDNRLWKFFLSTYFTFDRGDLNNVSSLYYNEGEEFGGAEKISTNGYDKITDYLSVGLDIKLNQRVSSIDYSSSKVKVTHNGNISDADYVVVTVPLGVLKKNKIQFSPALPSSKQMAIQKVGMNCVNKFLLKWETAFWDNEQYISYTPEVKDKFNYFVNLKKINPSVNALMTFAYADYARQTETMTDAQIISEIMSHLKDIYGSGIPDPTGFIRTKWNNNSNSYGSYSYTALETEMHHFNDLAEDIDGKVYFAGEHTNIDYFSTAHGAYLSGIREAEKIIGICNLLSNETRNDYQVKIHPNPSDKIINIDTKNNIKQITVYNEAGQIINLPLINNKLNVADLEKGTYFIKIDFEAKSINKKFIKN